MKLKEYVNMHKNWEQHLSEYGGETVGMAAEAGPSIEEARQALTQFDAVLRRMQGWLGADDISDMERIRDLATRDIEAGQPSEELQLAMRRVDTIVREEIPETIYYWGFPELLESKVKNESERAPYQRRNDERTLRDIADLHKRCKVLSQLTEGDAREYIDDAARNLYQAAEDIKYQAEISEDTKKSLNEGDFIGHHAEIDGKMYVDSNFLNSVRKIRDTFPSSLESMGFGEFYLKTPKGRIDFDRMRGKDFPGMVGRSHQLYAEPPELADELIDAMEQAGASETPQPSEEPPPGMPMQENLDSDSLHDALLDFIYQQLPEGDLESATPAILQALQSAIETINSPEANPHDGEMYEGRISRKDFMKMVREELQDEINKQIEPEQEDNFDMDTLRSMVREEVGGLIDNYKKSLEETHDVGVGHHDIFNMPEPEMPEPTGDPKEDAIREIVATHTAGRVEGVKLDLYSASAIVQILDALSAQNKEKYMAMPVDKMAVIAFKMMK